MTSTTTVCGTDTEERVKKAIAKMLGMDTSEIKLDSSLVDDLGADSLDVVEIVMELEEEFDHEITDAEAEKFTTVQQIVDYMNLHVK